MTCFGCGDQSAPVVPLERRGLKRAKSAYEKKNYCWACWYLEVANNYLYNGKNQMNLRDTLIYDQIHRLNSKALPRMNGGMFNNIEPDALMGVLLAYGGKSAISGKTGKLTFDHIKPLCDGGDHTLQNLRPALFYENLIYEALWFARDDEQREKITSKINFPIVWDWASESWRLEVNA